MDIKELKKIIELCRKTGVTEFKIDNIEFKLGAEPYKAPQVTKAAQNVTYAPGGITADTRIQTDELTDEQLLYYSAVSHDSDTQQ